MASARGDAPGAPVAVLTGGVTEIGVETIQCLTDRGVAVVLGYLLDQRAAEAVVERVLARRGAAVAIRADVTDNLDVERLFTETVRAFGEADALVHWVGGSSAEVEPVDVDAVELDALWRIEARAALVVNREAARRVRKGGAIVNVAGAFGSAATAGNVSSRAWFEALSRELARDLRARHVTVSAVWVEIAEPGVPRAIADIITLLMRGESGGTSGKVFYLNDR